MVTELGQLLQLQTSCIRLALRGCQSVFTIPDIDSDSVQPYHTSLRDFLTDGNQAKGHFLDALMHHVFISVDCLKLIMTDLENCAKGGRHLDYACQNWCYHFSLALSHHKSMGFIETCFGEALMRKVKDQWLKLWIYKLRNFCGVETICKDCDSAMAGMAVGLLFTEFRNT